MDLTGITNQNEYYTNHYFSSIFEENASETISKWRAEAKEGEGVKTPWSRLRDCARQYYTIHDRYLRSRFDTQTVSNIRSLADLYLSSLNYPSASPEWIQIDDDTKAPVYLEIKKANGAPALWVLLAASEDKESSILDKYCFSINDIGEEGQNSVPSNCLTTITNEDLVTKIFFGQAEPPRFVILIGMNQIALIDRNKWNEKRFLQFELEDIFSRHEESTLQAMAVLLHKDSLCPEDGTSLIDQLDANSQRHAAGVSQDLKYALRECIELLGNEVLYDMKHRLGRNFETDPVDAGQLTIECLRYMYRMLFMLFIESRPELGYAPIKAQSYLTGYSLESLRDIADSVRDDVTEVGEGFYLHESLSKLYDLIYNGYPKKEEDLIKYSKEESLHDMFLISPLKAHIFDPEYTKMISESKIRNKVMLRIIDLMSLTRETGRRNSRRGRISYANLGINQLGAVYEALLSYRGFIAEHTLFEVKKAGDTFNELDVGYFVAEEELEQYTEAERVRYDRDDPDGRYRQGDLRKYEKGTFIYRLAGREREKSASYYTPEVLTKCLVKYALKELLQDKTADEILNLKVCEPAMGSAAFLNEAINQLAEAYLNKKQEEKGELIPADKRLQELQKVKMYIADNNVYGIDLNPVAVELAEVSLWLNTIYEGGYVPWFGTQLVNGNSLIGARRQVYHKNQLTTSENGKRWYENAPERIPFTKLDASGRNIARSRFQVYHFLTGDPGMCKYTDRVIKDLEPENIRLMKNWNKDFIKKYSEQEFNSLIELSKVVDVLWKQQVSDRQLLERETITSLDIYGQHDSRKDNHLTIREKDKYLSNIYKSERAKNAGAYARLKFAMDYWCALWFWPITEANLLPTRQEFIQDMDMILRGVMGTQSKQGKQGDLFGEEISRPKTQKGTQGDLFSEDQPEAESEEENIKQVDLEELCTLYPRLALVKKIAEQNHFMHWELEFADLFAEHGGFDLIIGNPPWIKIEWNEQGMLSDIQPMFAVKRLTASETTNFRNDALESETSKKMYFSEYESLSGEQAFLNSEHNYIDLKGQQTNLFKCFLPQAWQFNTSQGVSAFIHPEGVYDDPQGGALREKLYPRLRKHFMFANERKLFPEVHHHTTFSLNVYGGPLDLPQFDSISNLYIPSTIEECYDGDPILPVPGIKDENGWCTKGHPNRIVHVSKKELTIFANIFDNSSKWETARLPVIHEMLYVDVLQCFANQEVNLGKMFDEISVSEMWHETNRQNDGTIKRNVHFPNSAIDLIISGPHILVSNPLFKASRRVCRLNSDYDNIDLTIIPDDYLQRCNYSPKCDITEYDNRAPITPWGEKSYLNYRIFMRNMLGQGGERTLVPAILSPKIGHVHAVLEIGFKHINKLPFVESLLSSLPYDFYIKCTGKNSGGIGLLRPLPFINNDKILEASCIALVLNCLTSHYSKLWEECWHNTFRERKWAKIDSRLSNDHFLSLSSKWDKNCPLRTDFERRQALIEIDVLVAMALGISLKQLISIYQSQFYILKEYESDTWYDANGRIVFTNNRSLTGVGYSRQEWENGKKGAPAGEKFYRTVTDDTMPGGPVERTIEYIAPFDRCDREKDYETAWKFFEDKYGKI
ncbi:class I SAM-dependent DNA methyltransferase [bacterium]|nr:class I SAM-dependent DNA methyltransferase [bacterium]